jgi:hypothetical protein
MVEELMISVEEHSEDRGNLLIQRILQQLNDVGMTITFTL